MQKIIQIYPCFLMLSLKQESVTDGQTGQTDAITISPHRYRGGGGIKINGQSECIQLGEFLNKLWGSLFFSYYGWLFE